MLDLLAIPACAALNRFRGGGLGASDLPGHPRFYAWAIMAGIALAATLDIVTAAGFGLAYLIWSFAPWGHLMCLGRKEHEPSRPYAWIETRLLALSNGNVWFAFGLLHLLFLLPAALMTPWALAAPLLIVAAYEMSWRLSPKGEIIRNAEVATGAVWGALVMLAA